MFVILPFEKEFYQTFGYEVDYVGNPVVDAVREHIPDPSFLQSINLNGGDRYIALLPGSRNQELSGILPRMIELARCYPEEKFILAAISTVPEDLYESCRKVGNIQLVFDRTNDILAYAYAGVITSGTATLETALWGVPQMVVYRFSSPVSYLIGRMVVKVKFISLVNLIAGKEVVRELIQSNLSVRNMKTEMDRLLYNQEVRTRMMEDYNDLKNILGNDPVSGCTADLMIHYLTH
jgi:lipid-A-disaccharide synthase